MIRILLFLSLISAICLSVNGPAGSVNADTLVVCPTAFQSALSHWKAYREKQGHQINVIAPGINRKETTTRIKTQLDREPAKQLILIGDVDRIPTGYVRAQVNVKFGSEPEIASDVKLVDFDNDGWPDINVARIPVDSARELATYFQRVINYESEWIPGSWRRRINIVGGVGGFGMLEDQTIQLATKRLVTDLIPADYEVSMTYAGWRSPYYPDPRRFSQTVVKRFNEGSLFWVYLGHGHKRSLDEVWTPYSKQVILDEQSVKNLDSAGGNPIALMMCCYSGAFDSRRDCLAELMMKQPNGPVATICATRVSMPYSMSVLSRKMMDRCFNHEAQTMGELFAESKRALVEPADPKDPYRKILDALANWLSPSRKELEQERNEHVHMFHLLGDPLLRIKLPGQLKIDAPQQARAGNKIEVQSSVPAAGVMTVEIVYRRDRFLHRDIFRKEFPRSAEQLGELQESYQKANDKIAWRAAYYVKPGEFKVSVPLPDHIHGDCFARVYLDAKGQQYSGARPLKITRNPGARRDTRSVANRVTSQPAGHDQNSETNAPARANDRKTRKR